MGERKGVNKYYPPDYDPTKGGLNKYHGTHALRERASKLHEGILIIRFEMPFNIWCLGCGNHIGMGVRYNAEKRKMGYYYTTPIYKFRMKCHLCDQYFEIQTDPKNCDYNLLSGCRRKEERWDTEAAGNVQSMERGMKQKLMSDAMFKLEHQAGDVIKAKKTAPTLTRLEELRDGWHDDFAVNQLLRNKFRAEKQKILQDEVESNEFKLKTNLPTDLTLLPEETADVSKAQQINFGHTNTRPDHLRKVNKRKIKQSSIFGTPTDSKLQLAISLVSHDLPQNKLAKPSLNEFGVQLKAKIQSTYKQSKEDNIANDVTSNVSRDPDVVPDVSVDNSKRTSCSDVSLETPTNASKNNSLKNCEVNSSNSFTDAMPIINSAKILTTSQESELDELRTRSNDNATLVQYESSTSDSGTDS